MLFLTAIKSNYFHLTPEHDVIMRSSEREQIWENIAASLNSLQQAKFRVTASQELFEIGIKKQKQKHRDEEKVSRIK